jgi:hypothetical protein
MRTHFFEMIGLSWKQHSASGSACTEGEPSLRAHNGYRNGVLLVEWRIRNDQVLLKLVYGTTQIIKKFGDPQWAEARDWGNMSSTRSRSKTPTNLKTINHVEAPIPEVLPAYQ